MYLEEHGGGCCGVNHIAGFGAFPERDVYGRKGLTNLQDLKNHIQKFIDSGVDDEGDPMDRQGIIEVTLTDDQMMNWAAELKKLGFTIACRALNSNSGNYVNLLTLAVNQPKVPREVPYTW